MLSSKVPNVIVVSLDDVAASCISGAVAAVAAAFEVEWNVAAVPAAVWQGGLDVVAVALEAAAGMVAVQVAAWPVDFDVVAGVVAVQAAV